MRMKKFLRAAEAATAAGLFLLHQSERFNPRMRRKIGDQFDDLVDRAKGVYNVASDRAVDLTKSLRRRQDHSAMAAALKLAAGVGVGIGVGLLMAPDTGQQTRRKLSEKAQEFGGNVRQRLPRKFNNVVDDAGRSARVHIADCA